MRFAEAGLSQQTNERMNIMKATTVQREPRLSGVTTEQPREFVSPEVNIFETGDGYVLEAEMPGVNKEGLEITLDGNEITIIGHRHAQPLSGAPLFRESTNADFQRVFELDPAIDTSKVSARM